MLETERGRMIAEKYRALFFECSAKTGRRVVEAFMAVASKVTPSCRPRCPNSLSPLAQQDYALLRD